MNLQLIQQEQSNPNENGRLHIHSYRGKHSSKLPSTGSAKLPSTPPVHYNCHQYPETSSIIVTLSLSRIFKESIDTYTNLYVKFLLLLFILFQFHLYPFIISFLVFYSGSVHCHWLSHATPEASLAHCSHDLSFSILKHSDNLSEGWTNFRVGVPAAGHDVTKHREAVIWNNWPYAFIHHSKCCLYCSHVLEGKQTRNELPKDNPKAIHIHFLCIGPMLDHLSETIDKGTQKNQKKAYYFKHKQNIVPKCYEHNSNRNEVHSRVDTKTMRIFCSIDIIN